MASEAEKTFQRFAVLGDSSSSGAEINNKNFSKLCQDCGITDGKTVTSTDVDTVFNKVKAKDAGTITFQRFTEAMKDLSQKRFKEKSPDQGLEDIFKLMEGKNPATTGVASAMDQHTDTRKYTGSHEEPLDYIGKGITGQKETTDNSEYGRSCKGAATYDKKN
ncbi:tubulin polymerization-promoting protein family member 2-like [Otolemur garnettii]|uniref:tubulin polymerization-promoting protein family member 2-like n=1 Tax=Otolemur garnettii TaxID=30611 RepID=UPI00064459E2|nr:tubulin polymerization-promoting protein family member 2-like [Otolemur garnettii]